jgi:hypothetical protein
MDKFNSSRLPRCLLRRLPGPVLAVLLLAGPGFSTDADTGKAVSDSAAETGLLPDFSASALWTGSWDLSGNLINRGDFRLGSFGLVARGQALDKRPGFFSEDQENRAAGDTALSGGLYHNRSGSRLLYGALEEWGLPSRLRNPWGKAASFVDTRRPMAADLRAAPSSTAVDEAYLYLGGPRLNLFSPNTSFRPYISIQSDGDLNRLFAAGLDTRLPGKTGIRVEALSAARHLAPQAASAWFSETPPLPGRDTRLYGAGVFFTSPFFSAAADGAFSETFAWGRGLYGNLALRLGDKPWELNLALSGADSRFVDRAGAVAGAAFRVSGRFEWKWKRTSFIRGGVDLRSPGYGEDFDRGAVSLYYRFPSDLKTGGPLPFRPIKVSAGISRDARDRNKVLDKAEAGIGFNLGGFGFGFDGSVTEIDTAETAAPWPFPTPASKEFGNAKISGDIFCPAGMLILRAKAGYAVVDKKAPVWDFSLSAAIRSRLGRFTLKISAPEFPREWTCSLSWRLQTETEYAK